MNPPTNPMTPQRMLEIAKMMDLHWRDGAPMDPPSAELRAHAEWLERNGWRTEWGIRSLRDGTHRGPMEEYEAREWAGRFPEAYLVISRQYSKWSEVKP
jgi:hypothetical protein